MGKAHFTPIALQNPDEIWSYIAQDNIRAADELVDDIRQTADRLVEFPELGRTRDKLQKGLRSFPVGSYLIFYRRSAIGIDVVKVLHGARDLRNFF